VRYACVEGSHAGCICTTPGLEDGADSNVLNECGVESGLGICGSKCMRKDEFGMGILEPTFPGLLKEISQLLQLGGGVRRW